MEAKKILKDLVAINTIADKDNNRIMDYIDSFLSNLGFEIERKKNAETGKEVLIGKYGENPAIGFLGHTDTVEITDGWTTDPHELTEKEREIAEKCAKTLGLDYCGVDLLSDENGNVSVCEVNSNAFFRGASEACKTDVAEALAGHILYKIIKNR